MPAEITKPLVVDLAPQPYNLLEIRRDDHQKEIPQDLFERVTGLNLDEGLELLADGSIIFGSNARQIAALLSDGLVDPRDPRVGIRDGSETSAPVKVSERDIDIITTHSPPDDCADSRTYPGRKVWETRSSSDVRISLHHYPEDESPRKIMQKITPLIYDCVWIESTPEGKLVLADPLLAYSNEAQHKRPDGVNPNFIANLSNMSDGHVVAMLIRLAFVSPYYLKDKNIRKIRKHFKQSPPKLPQEAIESIERTIETMMFTRYSDAGWVEEHFDDFGLLDFLRETFPKHFGLGYTVVVDDEGPRVRFRSYVDENGHYDVIRLNTQYVSGELAVKHPEIVQAGKIIVESCLTGPPASRGGYAFETTWIEVLLSKEGRWLGHSPIYEDRWFPKRYGSDPPPRKRNLWYK